ncbi:dihydroorotate dehydrogenase [Tabrizicola oligotrophica]|uniref:Dihydroorotate dehydrogenase n=1 Tax=Tabrizicola oligotrophica TaxID=2710650 RepID=A0A6M0QWX8_9RHOB|nr:dihydroorotate dehydrogenase [Tabrizicola oligotrophica]NEY91887.1 dihydroorotate dehydrogenase [Tabrizicola oligotrophica]
MTDDDLDGLFAAARAEAPRPSAALSARVISDAEAALQAAPAARRAPERPGLLASLAAIFGGGGALAGMVTATLAGFWIGFAQPVELGVMSAVLNTDTAEIDMMPGIDALLDEAP